MSNTKSAGPKPVPEPQPTNEIVATIELPSRGKFYGDSCPDGTLKIRPLTGRDEGLLAGMDSSNVQEVFDELLTRCIVGDTVSVDEMLSSDKFYLMLCLRANSYGGYYEFQIKCPDCGMSQTSSCTVPDDFEIEWFDSDESEPFEVTLPRSGVKVGLRLLRGKDEVDVLRFRDKELERRKSRRLDDPSYSYRMAKHIVTIGGERPENIRKGMEFFENLIALDSSEISAVVEDHGSGVNTTLTIDCQRCNERFKTTMPFGANFFRSQRRSSGGAA